jgi:hypothetical protein
MKLRMQRIGPLSAAKVLGALYFLLGTIAAIFLLLVSGAAGANRGNFNFPAGPLVFILPFMYGIGGFIGGLIAAALYNVVASVTGGIEFDFESVDAGYTSNLYQTPET